MGPVPVCTIVSNNYLALASVLAESYRAQHPGATVVCCVVDRPAPGLDYAALPFETVFAEELEIPGFLALAGRLGVLELNTAVKPFLLERLRERRGWERVFYLDPDIQVLAPLDELAAALERGSAVLLPHITAPLDDDRVPSERTVLMCGVYNLGFLGLRLDQATAPFLRWWQQRLARFCFHDVDHGLFVDQSWMDLAPALLPDVQVLRAPQYDVAYWNLTQRFPRQVGGRWLVDGRPLGFFHFSGLPFDDLEAVSRYQDRVRLSERPELRPLFEGYRAAVLAAGHTRLRGLPYAYGRFADGTPFADLARRVLQRVDPRGTRWPDPFAVGPGSCLEWLSEPLAYRGGWLNRALLSLWEERADLQRRFPDPFARDLGGLVRHLEAGAARLGLPAALLAGTGAEATGSAARPRAALPAGDPQLDVVELLRRGPLAPDDPLLDWLNEPVGDPRLRPLLTRLALAVHRQRADVQRRYPDPFERDRAGFAYWLVTDGARELDLPEALLRPVRATLPARSRAALRLRRVKRGLTPPLPPPPARPGAGPRPRRAPAPGAPLGVNLAGHFSSAGGVGQVARGTLAALRQAGLAWVSISLDRHPLLELVRGQHHPPDGAPHPVTLVHANADELAQALARVPAAAHAGDRVAGYWFWELSHFPLELAPAFDLVDEVWAPSRFVLEALRPLARVPVRLVPPCVPEPRPAALSRAELGWGDDELVIASAFDARSVPERKNPWALVEACRRAQQALPGRRLRLALVAAHAADVPGLAESLREAAAGLQLDLQTRLLPRDELDARLARADVYAALHRSEGLGLPPLEALLLGKPVVATAYGGLTDVLDEETGFPIPFRRVALARDLPPYPKGALWAEPDLEAAVAALRRIAEDPQEAARRGAAGRARARALYGLEAAAARFAAELRRLLEEGPRW